MTTLVYVHGNARQPTISITGSTLHSNGPHDLYVWLFANASETVVDATGNWWGSADASFISSRIRDHRRSDLSPLVDWCGFLDGPDGVPAREVYCPDLAVCDETAAWNLTDKPYLLVSDVVVCPTGSLQVSEGTQVRIVASQWPAEIVVEGAVDVLGTAESPSMFLSDAAEPAPADWVGLVLQAGATASLEHMTIRHASDGVLAAGSSIVTLDEAVVEDCHDGVECREDASVTMTGVTSRRNEYGLHVVGSAAGPEVNASGCSFAHNNGNGVLVDGNAGEPSVTVAGSSVHSNSGAHDYYAHDFANGSSAIAWAPDCWWGTSDLDLIRGRIHDHEDDPSAPRVYSHPFASSCDRVVAGDEDGDALGDFEDNCPVMLNPAQADADGDGMGDACDPDPGAAPLGACDGDQDVAEGFVDTDGDGWGDPCDFQPTRSDSYPGAPESCDGRDNDGDAVFAIGELSDADLDQAIECGDCDDTRADVYPCGCERCANLIEDDCDGLTDEADPDCEVYAYCVSVGTEAADLDLRVDRDTCGAAEPSGPFDVVRGDVGRLRIVGSQVDLGQVSCVAGAISWDRVTDTSARPNSACSELAHFYLARDTGSADFGAASGGEPRDIMNPDPPCP